MESSVVEPSVEEDSVEVPDTTSSEIPVTNSTSETATLAQDASMNPVVSLDKLVESTINTTSDTLSEPMEIPVEEPKPEESETVQEPEVPEPIVEPVKVNGAPQKPKQKANAFSLGVPGLNFSTDNVKTASDGTKMVQIHQSQISPEQLVALQNNPNIKVVFRHVPSGKSYSKTPRHMLPPGYSPSARKRKAQYPEEEVHSSDVYSFDEGEDIGEGPAKMMKAMENRARYNYGDYSMTKKKGKSRLSTEPGTYTSTYTKTNKQQSLPAKVILTDLLARVNHPNAKKEVRLHTSQINAEVLANLDLNPMYKIVLTTKQELPPLVVETVTPEEKAKLEKDAEEVEKQVKQEEKVTDVESKVDQVVEEEKEEEPEEMEQDQTDTLEEPEKEEEEDNEELRLAEEKERKRKAKEREKQRKAKEEQLMKSVMQTSRSGRVRKPSRFSLDIARLTKRKSNISGGDESSDNEQEETDSKTPKTASKNSGLDEQESEKSASKQTPTSDSTPTRQTRRDTRSSENETPKPTPTRGRGRPRKNPLPKEKEPEQIEKKTEDSKTENEKTSEKDTEKKEKGEEIPEAESGKEYEKIEISKPETEKTSDKEELKPDKEDSETLEDSTKEETIEKSEEKCENKTEETVSESEKEVTSTENMETSQPETEKAKIENESEEKEAESVISAEPDTSTDAVKTTAETEPKEDEKMDFEELLSLKIDEKEEEEKEVIDNKYRLRKLLEQCSADEIRSVMLPEAFDSINMGDFLLYKSAQMHNTNEKISFPQLYKEFEMLHKDATKEATRYNVLVRRANKVGGDKRMEKIVLMPVYNIEAANSLEISNSSIDAHICGIQRPMTTQMIAANSFFIRTKMDSPNIRLKLPETTGQKFHRQKPRRPLYSNQHTQKYMTNQQQEPDSTTPDKPKLQNRRTSYERKMQSMKHTILPSANESRPIQVRKPTYFEQLKATGQIPQQKNNSITSQNLQNIAAINDSITMKTSTAQISSASSTLAQFQAAANQHQSTITTAGNVATTDGSSMVIATTGELTTADTTIVTSAPSDTTTHAEEQFFVTEDGVPVTQASSAEDGDVKKHLVPIGEGQYVELPEGYSLIQTDEGYIIGQPGSTFTQGEDGNVYVTNSDGTTTEITEENVVAEGEAETVVDQAAEG